MSGYQSSSVKIEGNIMKGHCLFLSERERLSVGMGSVTKLRAAFHVLTPIGIL